MPKLRSTLKTNQLWISCKKQHRIKKVVDSKDRVASLLASSGRIVLTARLHRVNNGDPSHRISENRRIRVTSRICEQFQLMCFECGYQIRTWSIQMGGRSSQTTWLQPSDSWSHKLRPSTQAEWRQFSLKKTKRSLLHFLTMVPSSRYPS